jgi:hypothetical protein
MYPRVYVWKNLQFVVWLTVASLRPVRIGMSAGPLSMVTLSLAARAIRSVQEMVAAHALSSADLMASIYLKLCE